MVMSTKISFILLMAASHPWLLECQRAVSQASLTQFVQLQKWLRLHRKKSSHSLLRPCDFKGTGRGLQATQNIQPGDTIVSIPLKCLITVHTVLGSEIGSYMIRSGKRFTPQQILTIFLVTESCQRHESPWYAYINSLPDVYSTPLYFSVEEIGLLKHDTCKEAEALRNRFFTASRVITKFIENNTLWLAPYFTEDNMRWAWSTVDTRSVYLHTYPHPSLDLDPEESNVALAPFLDLLNHTDTAKVTAFVNTQSESYEIVTGDSFNKHDQVFISYGAHDNGKLLVNYGFVLPQNVNNTYGFTVEDLVLCVPASTQHIERKTAILDEANLKRSLVCSKDGISWSLSTALKIILLPWKLISNWKLLIQGISLGEDIEAKSQEAALLLIETALHKARKYMDLVKSHQDMIHHSMMLRLAQDDVDILGSTLATLA